MSQPDLRLGLSPGLGPAEWSFKKIGSRRSTYIPALLGLRQEDHLQFKVNPYYTVNSESAWDPV